MERSRRQLPFDRLVATFGLFAPAETYAQPVARTPGALLLTSPLILIDDGLIVEGLKVVSLGCLLFVGWSAARIARVPPWVGGVVALLLAGSTIMGKQFLNGNSGVIVAALIAATLLLSNRPAGGVALGVATVLKVWPAALIVTCLFRRETRRVGWCALGTVAGLSAVGLMLPGVSLSRTVAALVGGVGYMSLPGNVSAVGLLGVSVVVGGLIGAAVWVVGLASEHLNVRLSAAVVGGLLASPVTWPIYWLAALPAAAIGLQALLVPKPLLRAHGDFQDQAAVAGSTQWSSTDTPSSR